MTARTPSSHAIGIAQLVAWGTTFYAIPPLLPSISTDLGTSMSALSIAMTAGLVFNAVASLAVARWIQRRGARAPMVVGSITASIALLVIAASPGAAIAFGGLTLLGAAHAALLYEPAFAAVSAQTTNPLARTRAIQIVTFWGGWAALWALPAASLLGDACGWRATLLLLSALLAVHTIRIHARLPIAAARETSRSATAPISIGLAIAFALGAFATTAVVVNGLMLLADRSLSLGTASIVFALLAPLQVIGRLWFMRRNGQLGRHDGSIPFLLVAAGLIALLAAPEIYALASFVVLFGAGAGLLTTLRAAVVVRIAPDHVAQQLGVYNFVSSLARALAPAVSSGLYFAFGYELALITFSALALVAAVLVWHATSCRCSSVPIGACSRLTHLSCAQ